MSTTVELLTQAWERADAHLQDMGTASRPDARREMALAKTAIEEAQMRYTRGLAILQDKFAPADLEADT